MKFIKKNYQNLFLIFILSLCLASVIKYLIQGEWVSFLVYLVINLFFAFLALYARRIHCPFLLFLISAASMILFINTNNAETTFYNIDFLIQFIVTLLAGTIETIFFFIKKDKIQFKALTYEFIALCVLLVGSGITCFTSIGVDKNGTEVKNRYFSVPSYLTQESSQPGTVETVEYETKAYTTDQRALKKELYVYVPYGYDKNQQYNILYLLHGTGDNAKSWLITHSENKRMVDNLIQAKAIQPLLIVTPTFYTEKDSLDDLDQYTYHFKEELRNDILPQVEERYSTYAPSLDENGFASSRDHRAFAGLSRGAVTTSRSVLNGCLDYFSYFGMFSGMRTNQDYLKKNLLKDEYKDYSIHYLYMTSGAFDFALHQQVKDYRGLLKEDSRLKKGENTSFDVFPLKRHSFSHWDLSLYNYLQKIF